MGYSAVMILWLISKEEWSPHVSMRIVVGSHVTNLGKYHCAVSSSVSGTRLQSLAVTGETSVVSQFILSPSLSPLPSYLSSYLLLFTLFFAHQQAYTPSTPTTRQKKTNATYLRTGVVG